MPGYTKTLDVSDSADTPVIANSYTPEIHVCEDASVTGYPRSPFLVTKPMPGSTGIQKDIGQSYVFKKSGLYSPGEVAGYLRLPSGRPATTFSQDEL